MISTRRLFLLMAVLASTTLCSSPVTAKIVIKLGTIAPEGSMWHDALLETSQQWRKISDGEVELRIYAGGVLGGEHEMVRKMQRGGLDALAISSSGLPAIDDSVECLNIPLLFKNYEELDYVRRVLAPELEARFESKHYKVLSWIEGGWVHFFAKDPVRRPDDLRKLRLWVVVGDPAHERLAKELGFQPVPLPATDMLTGLQTGLIEAIDVIPLYALLDRSYRIANHMTDLKFAPLNAATVITTRAWDRIPEALHDSFVEVSRSVGRNLRAQIHSAEQEAIEEMVARGLTVVELDETTREHWRSETRAIYPKLNCARNHPDLFEKVLATHSKIDSGTDSD